MLLVVLKTLLRCNLGVTSVSPAPNASGAYIEHVSKDNKIVVIDSKDNKKVMMASNCCGMEPKLEISEALVASPSANRNILDEEDAIELVSPPVKISKYYNPKPCHDK
ncbi:hypothetical protein NPIL_499961 [Nephila pilipes]|uniref:Uncharacterized protein n=1 Tax=Nephila pilipes TaxID=299642 RepID=A0A8X6TTK9_NEPPI|nr:hypothetical protein NPIL_499961 [Nephila pilipes]